MSVAITAHKPPRVVYTAITPMPMMAAVISSQPIKALHTLANTRICTETQKTKVRMVTRLATKPVPLPNRR